MEERSCSGVDFNVGVMENCSISYDVTYVVVVVVVVFVFDVVVVVVVTLLMIFKSRILL